MPSRSRGKGRGRKRARIRRLQDKRAGRRAGKLAAPIARQKARRREGNGCSCRPTSGFSGEHSVQWAGAGGTWLGSFQAKRDRRPARGRLKFQRVSRLSGGDQGLGWRHPRAAIFIRGRTARGRDRKHDRRVRDPRRRNRMRDECLRGERMPAFDILALQVCLARGVADLPRRANARGMAAMGARHALSVSCCCPHRAPFPSCRLKSGVGERKRTGTGRLAN